MDVREFFATLHKRRFVQIFLISAGGAWFLLEVVGFFVSTYELPRKLLDIAVLLVVLGFVAALVAAWYHGERGHQQLTRSELWFLLTLGVIGAVGTYRISTAEESAPESAESEPPAAATATESSVDLGMGSMAILPFTNYVIDPSLSWLGPGLADMLTTNMVQVSPMPVVGRERLFRLLREAGFEETDEIPTDVAESLVRRTGARLMIRGHVAGSLDELTIDARLTRLDDGTVLVASRIQGNDVVDMVDTLSARLQNQLLVRFARDGPTGRPAPLPPAELFSRDPEALRAFQEAVRAGLVGDVGVLREHLEEAVGHDSTFVLALLRLRKLDEVSAADSARYLELARQGLRTAREAGTQLGGIDPDAPDFAAMLDSLTAALRIGYQPDGEGRRFVIPRPAGEGLPPRGRPRPGEGPLPRDGARPPGDGPLPREGGPPPRREDQPPPEEPRGE